MPTYDGMKGADMKSYASLLTLAVAATFAGCGSQRYVAQQDQAIPGGGYTYGTARSYTPAPVTAPLPLMTVDPAATSSQVPAGPTVITVMPGNAATLSPIDALGNPSDIYVPQGLAAEPTSAVEVQTPTPVTPDALPTVTRIVAPDDDVAAIQPDVAAIQPDVAADQADVASTPPTAASQELAPPQVIYAEPQVVYTEPQVVYVQPEVIYYETPTYVPVYVYSRPHIFVESDFVPFPFFDPFFPFAFFDPFPRPYFHDHDRFRDDRDHFRYSDYRHDRTPTLTFHAPPPPPPPIGSTGVRTLTAGPAPRVSTSPLAVAAAPLAPVPQVTLPPTRTAALPVAGRNSLSSARTPAPPRRVQVVAPGTKATVTASAAPVLGQDMPRRGAASRLETPKSPTVVTAPTRSALPPAVSSENRRPAVVAAPKASVPPVPVIEKAPARTETVRMARDAESVRSGAGRTAPRSEGERIIKMDTPAVTAVPTPSRISAPARTERITVPTPAPEVRSAPRESARVFVPSAAPAAPTRTAGPSSSSGSAMRSDGGGGSRSDGGSSGSSRSSKSSDGGGDGRSSGGSGNGRKGRN
jgi:hypothetical protein